MYFSVFSTIVKACDRICLVLYDDHVDVEFPLTLMTKENKELTKAKVKKIRDRGATNLCGGLLKGTVAFKGFYFLIMNI